MNPCIRFAPSRAHRRHLLGFTLIELMITVAVIGVLSAVALPSYQEYINRQRRADAQIQLMAAQLWMERFYSVNLRYDQDSGGTAVSIANQPFVTSPPAGGGTAQYNISLTTTARNAYTLTATRAGSMASDACGNFTLTNTGQKSLVSYSTSKYSSLAIAVAACWR